MNERMFPILRTYEERKRRPADAIRAVPWALVAPYEEQARLNHSQTLERLAQRGGLGPEELYATVHGLKLRDMPTTDVAEAWLTQFAQR